MGFKDVVVTVKGERETGNGGGRGGKGKLEAFDGSTSRTED